LTHTHKAVIYHRRNTILATDSVVKQEKPHFQFYCCALNQTHLIRRTKWNAYLWSVLYHRNGYLKQWTIIYTHLQQTERTK